MVKKITIEEFRKFNEELKEILDLSYNLKEDELNELLKKYLQKRDALLSYDLSGIPFDEWKNASIYGDEKYPIDFSKSKANIDFDFVDFFELNNYKGCKIKNLNFVNKIVDSKNFDQEFVESNPKYFLSNNISPEIKKIIYLSELTIPKLFTLDVKDRNELIKKQIFNNFELVTRDLIEIIGLDRVIELYSKYPDVYEAIYLLYSKTEANSNSYLFNYNKKSYDYLMEQSKKIDVSELKNLFFNYFKKRILESDVIDLNPENYPKLFIEENDDLFLNNFNISDDLKKRYYFRKLTIDDVLDNPSLLKNENLLDKNQENYNGFIHIINTIGFDVMIEFINQKKDLLLYIINSNNIDSFCLFAESINNMKQFDKNKLLEDYLSYFEYNNKIQSKEELLLYNPKLFKLDKDQENVINILGLENIKRLEHELSFFSHKENDFNYMPLLNSFVSFFNYHDKNALYNYNIDFKNGTLPYEEFLNQIALCLNVMKKSSYFVGNPLIYDWIDGEFRENHSDIFISKFAPSNLKNDFYENNISAETLYNHKEYIPYLLDKDISFIIKNDAYLTVPSLLSNSDEVSSNVDFSKEYIYRYGNEKYLNLLSKYGLALENLNIMCTHNEIENESKLEEAIIKSIHENCSFKGTKYAYLKNIPEIYNNYPEIFIDLSYENSISDSEKERLIDAFYNGNFSFGDIKKYPQLIDMLKTKELSKVFRNELQKFSFNTSIINCLGYDKFLQLGLKYGKYIGYAFQKIDNEIIINNNKIYDKFNKNTELNFDDICNRIETNIKNGSFSGELIYSPEDAPDFLKNEFPELFLNDEAPKELERFFYNLDGTHPLTFEILKNNENFMEYLKNKSVKSAILRNKYYRTELSKYFMLFEPKAIKLGLNRTETVSKMIENNQVYLMKEWYDKTGCKFIPDIVVMQNFDITDADKFLLSGKNWSRLMKISSFSNEIDSREAMLKIAYSFGAFDNDQRGFKKLEELLTGIPIKINSDKEYIINRIVNNSLNVVDNDTMKDFISALEKDNVKIDMNQNIFSQIYRKNEDGSYSLTIDPQQCPNCVKIIRKILEKFNEFPILNANKAHKLFGGFKLEYNPEFREFLLDNIDKILIDPSIGRYIPMIQKQFNNIKVANSNRRLTLDLAISYVNENKYTNVELGNERVAEVSSIAGYSQSDFEELQKIFDYGKKRTFSSIPRINNSTEKYNYEILRLDDPLAMAIGTLTDCCQELNNAAEMCMEHSMVDQNGRVFVIRDKDGNIVAQSWVWRNKDVLCFDNIEIPDRAFNRAIKDGNIEDREQFTDDVYNIYKKAAQELIKKDNDKYKKLLEEGKISVEEYEGLKLKKVTVGLGYNDIASSLKRNSKKDDGLISGPLPFEPPVKLRHNLYTNDSITQYVLEKEEKRNDYQGETLPIYNDEYNVYNDKNFPLKEIMFLNKLSLKLKGHPLLVGNDIDKNNQNIISELGKNYGLNPENTRIVMNSNFAIIYEEGEDKIRVGELLFNYEIANNEELVNDYIIMQIYLAINQISKGKEIDISLLNENQKSIYMQAANFRNNIDRERGIGYAK